MCVSVTDGRIVFHFKHTLFLLILKEIFAIVIIIIKKKYTWVKGLKRVCDK